MNCSSCTSALSTSHCNGMDVFVSRAGGPRFVYPLAAGAAPNSRDTASGKPLSGSLEGEEVMQTYGSQSMYAPLRRVLVKRPDEAFAVADPVAWHYTARPDLLSAQQEHDALVALLRQD